MSVKLETRHFLRVGSIGVAAMLAACCHHPECVSRHTAVIREGPALPRGRGSHAGGCIKGQVIIAGGSAWSEDRTVKSWLGDSLVFDMTAKTWIPGPSLPRAFAEMAYACDGEALYIAGGKDGQSSYANAYRISDVADKWKIEPLPPLPVATSGCAGAMLDGVFYVACGHPNGLHVPTDAMWALDTRRPGAGWRSCAPVPSPARAYPALTECGGRLILLGGVIAESEERPTRQVFHDVHRYDPAADAWTRLADLPSAGQGWCADAIDAQHLLVVGRGDTNIYPETWIVDLKNSSTRNLGDLVIQSFGAPLVRISPGKWWFIAGEPDANKTRTPRVSVIEVKAVRPLK
jgi:hypothetical protein